MTTWVDPTTFWSEDAAAAQRLETLRAHGDLLVTWPPAAFECAPTYCYRLGQLFHIWQPARGGITFTAATPSLVLHPLPEVDRALFWMLVSRSWLPAIYPLWGRQVLHASAAANAEGVTVGFSGPSGAGKSTIAYALGQRAGWSTLADDTIAFSCSGDPTVPVTLHPLRLQSRLRIETARHFGKENESEEAFSWPEVTPVLTVLYLLDGSGSDMTTAIAKEPLASSYAGLLNQAHAMTLAEPALNQRLMRDYATLATNVQVFRLSYPKSFSKLDAVLDRLESHVRTLAARPALIATPNVPTKPEFAPSEPLRPTP